MNRYILSVLALILLSGCQTSPPLQLQDVQLTEAELQTEKWSELKRFAPKYPVEEAIAGRDGCAAVEYVITPSYEIRDVKVLSSSSRYFAKQAELTVKNWKWSELPQGIIAAPVKTITQFRFCLDAGDGRCSVPATVDNAACSGKDTIYSIGYRIVHKA